MNELSRLESVGFHGDQIEAIRGGEGKVFVGVKRVSENVGVDFSGQLQKLKSCAWSTVEIISTVDAGGKTRELAMLPLEQLPMWMVTINAGKVAEEIRPKLIAYQKEAASVLARHFLGEPKPQPPATGDPRVAMLQLVESLTRAQIESERKAAETQRQLEGVTAGLASIQEDVNYLKTIEAEPLRLVAALSRNDVRRAVLLDIYIRQQWKSSPHNTFGAYIQAELGISQSYALRQVYAAIIEQNVAPDKPVGTYPESVLRPLHAYRNERRLQQVAWNMAMEATGGKPTANAVHRALADVVDMTIVD